MNDEIRAALGDSLVLGGLSASWFGFLLIGVSLPLAALLIGLSLLFILEFRRLRRETLNLYRNGE